jgi:DNA mismatch repair ATPase MutL
MRQHSLLLHVNSLTLPWPTRPLLVPITLQVKQVTQLHVRYQPILLALGFIFEILDQNQIKIASIPLDFPMLDVRYLMLHLNEVTPTQQELTHLLLKSDGWDLTMITGEEEESWMNFWLNKMKSKQEMPYSVLLNGNQCEAFFCE